MLFFEPHRNHYFNSKIFPCPFYCFRRWTDPLNLNLFDLQHNHTAYHDCQGTESKRYSHDVPCTPVMTTAHAELGIKICIFFIIERPV